jgi:hypothetical protein
VEVMSYHGQDMGPQSARLGLGAKSALGFYPGAHPLAFFPDLKLEHRPWCLVSLWGTSQRPGEGDPLAV